MLDEQAATVNSVNSAVPAAAHRFFPSALRMAQQIVAWLYAESAAASNMVPYNRFKLATLSTEKSMPHATRLAS
jgi:hypothetical protein